MAAIIGRVGTPAFGFMGTTGVMGLGSFGRFLFEQFRRTMPFTGLYGFDSDLAKEPNCSFIKAATCDVIFLAVPIPAFGDTLRNVIPVMKPGAILIDVCTVKLHTVGLLQRYASAAGRSWIATHPLFGPESYKANGGRLKGLPLVICERDIESDMCRIVRDLFIEGAGLDVYEMSADEHDRTVGVDQFVTQYFGRCVEEVEGWGIERPVQTYSAKLFHQAMSLVRGDEKLFWTVYKYNPYCKAYVDQIETKMLAMRERRNCL